MKRPFACIGLSMLFSLVFAVQCYAVAPYVAVACFVISGVLFCAKFIVKKDTLAIAVCCLSACIAMLSYCGVIERYVKPLIEEFDGQTVEFTATVTSKPYTTNNNTYFTVKTDSINGEEKNVNIQIITSYVQPLDIYDSISGTAELYSDYESGYGYASYYGARDIFLHAYINPYYESSYEVMNCDNRPFYAIFSDLRDVISTTLSKYLPYDEASLATAVITGEKSYLRDEIYTNFKNLGISHILVVSGLHLSFVYILIYSITKKTIKNVFHAATIQVIGVVAFAALTGFGFSVIRALIMSIVMIIGIMSGSQTDGLNTLGFAAMILCLNPLNAGDIGMLWSFSCTLFLIILSKPIYDYISKYTKSLIDFSPKIISLFSTAISAFIGSLPFLIFITGSFSPYTILANVLTVPFTGILIICGGLAVVFFSIKLSIIAYPLMYICGMISKYLIFITDTFSELPMASIRANMSYVYIWFILSFVAILFVILFKKELTRYVAFSMASLLLILSSLNIILNSEKISLTVLDVGNGITITINDGNNVVLLNSYGEKYQYRTIKEELSRYNKISCLIDFPPEIADYDYTRKITKDFDVEHVFLYDNELYKEEYSYHINKGISVSNIKELTELFLFENAKLNIIPCEDFVWEYLNVYGIDILICPTNADFAILPTEFANPDIAIINDIPANFSLSDNTHIIVSNYGEDCNLILEYLKDNDYSYSETNGLGQIDIGIDIDGQVELSRVYTGGIIRYDDT